MPRYWMDTLGLSLAVAIGVGAAAVSARSEEPFAGKSVDLIIGYGAGGGYDTYGRLLANHIGRHLPGKPAVVPKNMPGAGSIRAADHLYFNAAKDGSVIGIVGDGLYLSQQLGEAKIRFDTLKFNWIGRMAANTPVLFAWHQSPIQKPEDIFSGKMIVSAVGSTPRLNFMLLNDVLGIKTKAISGYKGSHEALLAMERSEIHGLTMPWPVVLSQHGGWVKEKKINPILQTGAEKHVSLPDIPRMIDLAKNDDDKKLFEFLAQSSRIGRSIVAPPDLMPGRAAMLRAAFMATMRDKTFLADAERGGFDLSPLGGEELGALIAKDGMYPKQIVERAREAVEREKSQNKKQ